MSSITIRNLDLIDCAYHSIRVIQTRRVHMDTLYIHNRVNGNNDRQPMGAQGNQPGYGGGDQQPYLNGAAEGDDEGEGGDNNPGDGFPPTRDMGNGNNTHYQQGRPQQGNGQGHGGGGW